MAISSNFCLLCELAPAIRLTRTMLIAASVRGFYLAWRSSYRLRKLVFLPDPGQRMWQQRAGKVLHLEAHGVMLRGRWSLPLQAVTCIVRLKQCIRQKRGTGPFGLRDRRLGSFREALCCRPTMGRPRHSQKPSSSRRLSSFWILAYFAFGEGRSKHASKISDACSTGS